MKTIETTIVVDESHQATVQLPADVAPGSASQASPAIGFRPGCSFPMAVMGMRREGGRRCFACIRRSRLARTSRRGWGRTCTAL